MMPEQFSTLALFLSLNIVMMISMGLVSLWWWTLHRSDDDDIDDDDNADANDDAKV